MPRYRLRSARLPFWRGGALTMSLTKTHMYIKTKKVIIKLRTIERVGFFQRFIVIIKACDRSECVDQRGAFGTRAGGCGDSVVNMRYIWRRAAYRCVVTVGERR